MLLWDGFCREHRADSSLPPGAGAQGSYFIGTETGILYPPAAADYRGPDPETVVENIEGE